MCILKLENVSKAYGNKKVLEKLSFSFEKGKIYSVSGKSGCGKTTLFNVISGYESCTEGSVSKCRISMSFQEPSLLPSCNLIDNVMLGSDISEKDKDITKQTFILRQREKAECFLRELGITDVTQKPSELSGGMQARVGIARALMRKASVYLFDEPFSGLDSESIAVASSFIRRHICGSTVIAVIHDSTNCPDFADIKLKLERDGITKLIPLNG